MAHSLTMARTTGNQKHSQPLLCSCCGSCWRMPGTNQSFVSQSVVLHAQIRQPGHQEVGEIADHFQQHGCATGFTEQWYMKSARTMLSGRPLGPDDSSDKIPVILHSGLKDTREKLFPLGAEPRYVGKMGDMQQISIYVLWAILSHVVTSWQLRICIYDPQVACTTHNISGWAPLPDCDICCQFGFTELWGEVVGFWRFLTFVFLLPLYSPHFVD